MLELLLGKPLEHVLEDSLEGCGLAVMDKCYEHNPPDKSTPSNLIEVIYKICLIPFTRSYKAPILVVSEYN